MCVRACLPGLHCCMRQPTVMQSAAQTKHGNGAQCKTGGANAQAASFEIPDAVATCAHPILKALRDQIPDEAQYVEVAELVRHLCHPQAAARATADAALQARLFTPPAPTRCHGPVWCANQSCNTAQCCLHGFLASCSVTLPVSSVFATG